tara:strand:+ start:457 stop:633 length:177 start_codon:yes stop_codon:yes gene_type:complete
MAELDKLHPLNDPILLSLGLASMDWQIKISFKKLSFIMINLYAMFPSSRLVATFVKPR